MKEKLKSIIPKGILEKRRIILKKKELNTLFRNDKRRFQKYSASEKVNYDRENVRSQIMYFSHQIEKGLSRKNFRYGFGLDAIINLVDALQRMKKFSNWEEDDFYRNGISSLSAYVDRHSSISEKIPVDIISEIKESKDECAGVIEVTSKSKNNNSNINFKKLAMNRISVRDFKDGESIDIKDLEEAIEICIKTPSVCNRQSSRVKIVTDAQVIERILFLQGGFGGYELPDKLLLVTNDLSVFLRAQERNQAFVDGGLFCMSLLYALEYKSIGACPLSVNISQEKVHEIRKILSIPESETPIMFIACGIIDDHVTSPKSYRSPASKITEIF